MALETGFTSKPLSFFIVSFEGDLWVLGISSHQVPRGLGDSLCERG